MKMVTSEWLRAAHDDLAVIAKIEDDEALTHMVAFHAQQCLEKALKAIIEERQLESGKIHSLRRLLEICANHFSIPEQDCDAVILLDKAYIDARYPGEMGLLPDGRPSLTEARAFAELAQRTCETVGRLLICSTTKAD